MGAVVSEADMMRARARAYAAGIRVVARGRRNADGAVVLFTTSSQGAGKLHAVAVTTTALECDCKAGQHGAYCCHRIVVHDTLVAERATAHKRAQVRHAARPAVLAPHGAEAARMRDTAPLARDNRGFSLWKA